VTDTQTFDKTEELLNSMGQEDRSKLAINTLGNLGADAQTAAATELLSNLGADAQAAAATGLLTNMTDEQKQQVLEPFSGAASSAVVADLWRKLLYGLIGIAIAAVVAAVVLGLAGKTADAAWPVVTAVVAGLVGLVAPSPVAKGSGS